MTSEIDQKQAGSKPQDTADERAKKEELVEARIRMMRKKNEELMKRQQEIEEDRRNANKYSEMVVIKKHVSGVLKESPPTGRGRGRGLMLEEMRKETLKAKQWEAKRRENVLKEEQERNQRTSGKTSNSTSRFLADDRRVDMSRAPGRNEHSWGGANFNKAANRMHREKEGFRSGRSKGNIELTMSGKERHQYYKWREERTQIDEERKARQKKAGNWSRAWDQRKVWDSKKNMWEYEDEDDADDQNEGRRRRQPSNSSEVWGSDNRSKRMDNRSHGKGEQGSRQGFSQHHDQEMAATEDWGDTSEKSVIQNKLPGSKTETDNKIIRNQSKAVAGLSSTDWEVEIPTVQEKENSDIAKEAVNEHPHSDALTPQGELKETKEGDDSVTNDQHTNGGDSHASQESATELTSDHPHSSAPKSQRGPRQQQLNDAVVNSNLTSSRNSHKEQGLATEKMSTSDENVEHEPPTGDKKTKAVSGHLPSGGSDGENVEVITEDVKGTSSPVDEKQDTTNLGQSVDNVQTSEGKDNGSKSSQTHKANLPKLVTKVDRKVSFDTEENDFKTDSESKEREVSLDIPPTPDFLKIDNNIDWGDIEVDEDEVVERWS